MGEHFEIDELVDIIDAVDVFGDPEQGVEIAQAAFAFLDVGLDEISGIAHAGMPLVALEELRLQEIDRRSLDDLGVEAALEIEKKLLVAPDVACLKDRRADR